MLIMHETYTLSSRSDRNGKFLLKEERIMAGITSTVNAELTGQRVVVIGGTSGIGLAVAQEAIAQGAQVVIASSNRQRVQQVVSDLGRNAQGHPLDVSDEQAIVRFFAKVGEFDHLVFTAGDSLQLAELATMDLAKARNAFELRYWGALAAAKYGSPRLRRGGSITLTTGIAGDRPQGGWALGASVCGAMSALTRALAMELAPIRVNAVSPGIVRTNLWRNLDEQQREGMYESVGKGLPVGRVGEVGDIARTYLYLMQEGFSTGQVITVDGGAVLV
jgi:NAD(P)-dependent dehydrogenase (short-subunit alcohol dehydrogenase family)